MSKKRVFNTKVNANQEYQTESLKDCSAFYILAPDITDEVIIDFYLQYEVEPSRSQGIEITPEPLVDSMLIYTIPQQYGNTDFDIYGVLTSDVPTTIEVWGITQDLSLKTIDEKLNEILGVTESTQQRVDLNNVLQIGDLGNEIAQNTAFSLLSGSLSVVTGGTSLSAVPVLTASTSSITPLLTAGIGL